MEFLADRVRRDGFAVLPAALTPADVAAARATVLAHRHLLRNTRPTPSAGHLAGFHRFPELEPLHTLLTSCPGVRECIARLCPGGARTIEMSDITVDRSQAWHKDLLRGPFRTLLGCTDPCARWHSSAFKVLLYLQPSSSLVVVPGSHERDVDLSDDEAAVPHPDEEVVRVAVQPGDVVVLDVCCTHRGSDEDAFRPGGEPKVLVSTVFGASGSTLADRLELGNAVRLAWWMKRTEGGGGYAGRGPPEVPFEVFGLDDGAEERRVPGKDWLTPGEEDRRPAGPRL
ncbi:hypothetical protein DFJ74DRAFT_706366 [Hyaloraphidium curvatum]|nr:hypothetical protein DFJ74DRAFT_706366 [Hyaloraphidium curvatum]